VDPEAKSTGRRRRGAELEGALLDAAWDDLIERGYSSVSMDSVAERAGTSRTVLYRRWPSRGELVVAAIRRHYEKDVVVVPDSGSLRADLLRLLHEANEHRSDLAGYFSVLLADYFSETASTPAALRERLLGARETAMDIVLRRAEQRGEIELARIPQRVQTLPFDLFRHEALMTLRPVSDEFILSVVDDIFLPLVLQPKSDA